jgi:DnaK suppressor protein
MTGWTPKKPSPRRTFLRVLASDTAPARRFVRLSPRDGRGIASPFVIVPAAQCDYRPATERQVRVGSPMKSPSADTDYKPREDEPFMNDRQKDYFRRKLLAWKQDILREAQDTIANLQAENENHPDLADRASSETDRAIELRARDRQRKLISKIDAALSRIDDGSYGYCEETGEPIALKRLDARPIATLSLEAQERHERRERVYRDD